MKPFTRIEDTLIRLSPLYSSPQAISAIANPKNPLGRSPKTGISVVFHEGGRSAELTLEQDDVRALIQLLADAAAEAQLAAEGAA